MPYRSLLLSGVPGDTEEARGATAGPGEGEARAGSAGAAEEEGCPPTERGGFNRGQAEASGEVGERGGAELGQDMADVAVEGHGQSCRDRSTEVLTDRGDNTAAVLGGLGSGSE